MKTLIIFYSYTGNVKTIVAKKAEELGADVIELSDVKRRGAFATYTLGSISSRLGKKAKLNQFNKDFSAYDKIIIAVPIWAGYPAMPFNNVAEIIPDGKDVELIFSSGGGYNDKIGEKAKALLEKRGANVTGITHVKGDGTEK